MEISSRVRDDPLTVRHVRDVGDHAGVPAECLHAAVPRGDVAPTPPPRVRDNSAHRNLKDGHTLQDQVDHSSLRAISGQKGSPEGLSLTGNAGQGDDLPVGRGAWERVGVAARFDFIDAGTEGEE